MSSTDLVRASLVTGMDSGGKKGSSLAGSRQLRKKGCLGGTRLAFESIVEEVRRFVACMPPVDSTTGSACFPWSFSALADQRAGILPVQRQPTLAVGRRCMMRLTRISIFPFFPLSITDWFPLHRGAFHNAQRTSLETGGEYTA
jgi:hypothetical protein